MSRRSRFRASGKNDVWFAVFCVAAVILVSLQADARDTNAPERPAWTPANEIKE